MPKKRRETPFSKDDYREMYNNLWKMGPEQGKVNYIKKIIIGPSSNFAQQKYAVNDLIKQLTHRSIYKEMLTRGIDYNFKPDELEGMPNGLKITSDMAYRMNVESNYSYFCISDGYIDLPDIHSSKIPFKT